MSRAQVPNRVTQAVDPGRVAVLANHHPLWANAANDAGALPSSNKMAPMTLVLARSVSQEQAFKQLIADQHNPASPEFHQWLTPTEVGERFGLSDGDLTAITGWLQDEGLRVDWISPSRNLIGFSGTAGAVGRAFGTEIHAYDVHGERRISVATEPTIPQALEPAIEAVRGLYTIEDRPQSHVTPAKKIAPQMTVTNGSTTAYFIAPADFNTIYNVPASLTGAGETIGIVSESRTDFADFSNFRSLTGVTFPNPTEVIPTAYGGVDPGAAYTSPPSGSVSTASQVEATLDVTRAGSVAPGANLLLVAATEASGGIVPDTEYLVESSPVPANIINISFGECESEAGSSGVAVWDALFEQAASEGISVFVSSGDSGASGCDTAFTTPPASPAANSPNSICSSSYVTCVGGTEFNDTSNPTEYWNAADGANLLSAVSYIPEGGWNEPGTSSDTQAASSGGGVSAYIATPSWQTGTGVPSARTGRYTPDVSFSASCHDSYFGCMNAAGGSCVAGSDGSYYFVGYCGTSASAPGMAGVGALLNQKLGVAQGNLNAQIYQEAAATSAAFNDVTVASSGVASCSVSTPSMCNNSIPSATSLTGGQAGYLVTTGYDEVTGLGSLNVTEFLDNFTAKLTPTVTVSPSPTSITTTQSVTVTVTVSDGSANPTPTGTVTLTSGSYASSATTLASGTASITVPAGSLSAGTDTLTATYEPDGPSSTTYAGATGSQTEMVTAATKTTPTVTVSPSAAQITTAETLTVTVTVAPTTGNPTPTGSVTLASGSYSSAATTLASGTAAIVVPAGSLATGTDTLTATYSPDANGALVYNSATGTGSITVTAQVTPTVTVTPSPATITTAQSTTVTIAVAAGGGYGTPTGSVTLTSGSYTSAATTLASGSASITVPAGSLAAGADTLTATYTPDSTSSPIYNSTTGTHSITVTAPKSAPAVTVSPSAAQITTAETLTVTISVAPTSGNPTPTGSVTVASGSYTSAATTLSSGSAAIVIPPGSLATGTDTLTATYTPDSNSSSIYNSSTGTGSITVTAKETPTVTVSPSPSTITTAQATTVTITVGAAAGYGTPTGSVEVTSGSYTSAVTTLSSGSASITIPAGSLASGSDTLTASYTPDSTSSATYNTASGTHAISVSAAKITPTVTVTPSASQITTAQSLSVTVSVNGGSGTSTATGSVTLASGSYTSAATTLSGGSTSITIPAGSLATGTDTLTATYTPDSTSSPVYNPATGTGSVTVTAKETPSVTVAPSPASITTAQSTMVTITVGAVGGYGTPTGSVTLTSGSYSSAVTTLASGSASITIPAGSLATGTDMLMATYTPDSTSSPVYNPATGTQSVTVTVAKKTATVTVSPSAASVTVAESLTVTISVNGGSGNPTPTGSVTLASGSYISSAATLSSGVGTIVIPANTLVVGADTLTATYTPDSNSSPTYASSTGAASITVTSLESPPVVVTPGAADITPSQGLTVGVTAAAVGGYGTPTGSVILTSGIYTSAATTLASGEASIAIPAGSLALGTDTLTVTYTPDSNSSLIYTSSTGTSSVTVSTTVQPGFTLSSGNVTFAPGATTGNTSTITVTPAGGFSGSVTLTAEITSSPAGAADPPTLSFGSSSPVVISSASAATATLTISTTAPTSGALTRPLQPTGRWYAAGGTAMACLLFFCIPMRRRRWRTLLGMVMFAVFAGLAISCTSGSSASETTTPPSKLTPTVTVTPTSSSIDTDESLKVNIAVSGGASNPTPTGSVTLSSGSYASAATVLSGGDASITVPAGSLSSGNDTLYAAYTPDASSSSTYNGAAGNSAVAVSVPEGGGTTAGNYTVTVTGTWGAISETTSFIVTVQ
jgi:subtilase family serine protease